MKTYRLLLLIAISLSSLTMNGQEKELKEAIRSGKKTNFMYTAHPSNLTLDKFKKWASKQDDYIIKSYKTDKRLIFGHETDCVSEISFIPMSEKEAYQKYLAALEEKRREQELNSLIATGAAIAGTALLVGAIVKAFSGPSSTSSGSSSSSSTSSSSNGNKYAFHCYHCEKYVIISKEQANSKRITCPKCRKSDDYETFWICGNCENYNDRRQTCSCGRTE